MVEQKNAILQIGGAIAVGVGLWKVISTLKDGDEDEFDSLVHQSSRLIAGENFRNISDIDRVMPLISNFFAALQLCYHPLAYQLT